jgi:hypothetical protein
VKPSGIVALKIDCVAIDQGRLRFIEMLRGFRNIEALENEVDVLMEGFKPKNSSLLIVSWRSGSRATF